MSRPPLNSALPGQAQQAGASDQFPLAPAYAPPYASPFVPLHASQYAPLYTLPQPSASLHRSLAFQPAYMYQQHPVQPGAMQPYHEISQHGHYLNQQAFHPTVGATLSQPIPSAHQANFQAWLPQASSSQLRQAEHSSVPLRARPNDELCPGVFRFQIVVLKGKHNRKFDGETDMPWEDVRSRVHAYLDSLPDMQLVYRVTGDKTRWSNLHNAEDFATAMNCLCAKAAAARTKKVCLDVKDMRTKHTWEEDIPPPVHEENSSQLKAFRNLAAETHCELHGGHCHVNRQAGPGKDHRRLDHREMTLWAKKISLGQATVFPPPNAILFDCLPAKRPRLSGGLPEVHVTINAPGLSFNPTEARATEDSPMQRNGKDAALSQYTLSSAGSNHRAAAIDFPRWGICELEGILLEVGLDDVSKIVVIAKDLLEDIGGMGAERAKYLQEYARYGAAAMFGLSRTWMPALTPPVWDAPPPPMTVLATKANPSPPKPSPPVACFQEGSSRQAREGPLHLTREKIQHRPLFAT
ncbi:hypothetical protein BC835DRAFT_1424041 [Cytidiella melzeri]|nr:hypothetical protein BC835DRAFT_1424041 [Cytidiella melzeri]